MQNYLKKSKLIIFSRFALKICITRIKVKYYITDTQNNNSKTQSIKENWITNDRTSTNSMKNWDLDQVLWERVSKLFQQHVDVIYKSVYSTNQVIEIRI